MNKTADSVLIRFEISVWLSGDDMSVKGGRIVLSLPKRARID